MLKFGLSTLKNNWVFTIRQKSRIYLIINWMQFVYSKFLARTPIFLHRSQLKKKYIKWNKISDPKVMGFFYFVCRKYHTKISHWAIPLFLWNVYESISFWILSLWESTCQAWERYERQWCIRFLFLICYREFRNKKPNNKERFRLFLFCENKNNPTSKVNS